MASTLGYVVLFQLNSPTVIPVEIMPFSDCLLLSFLNVRHSQDGNNTFFRSILFPCHSHSEKFLATESRQRYIYVSTIKKGTVVRPLQER